MLSETMLAGFSFCQAPRVLVFLSMAVWLIAAKSSGQWITVKKITPNPVFVTVGQTLKLRLDIENLQVDKWNTTAFWVYSPVKDASSPEQELQWVRNLGSNRESYYTYNETRISRERQVDLVMKGMKLSNSGVYRCKFRKPPQPWSIWIEYNVVVEEDEIDIHRELPQIVHVARGDTLKLKPKVSEILADFDDKIYEIFWDFSTPLASKQEEAVRIIGLEDGSLKSFDVRASLEENSATLVLTNTTFNDSGIYHLRTMKSLSAKAIHKDFHVIIEDQPVAHMQCQSIVHLSEGENFFCLCEDISTSDVKATVSWLRNGHSPKHSRRFHEEELYLKNVSAVDAGHYICKVRTETKTVEITLEVLVFPTVEKDTRDNKKTQKHPDWHFLAGSLGVGFLSGIACVLMIIFMRRKCRNIVYEDVRKPPESPDLELNITEQYHDMNRETSVVYEDADSTSPYEIADLTCPIYMDMNEGKMKTTQTSPASCSHQNENALFPGYTDLDHRNRVDSHSYQGLQQFRLPGDRM